MTMEALHSLLDCADKSKLDVIYSFLIRVVEQDEPTEDEIEAILRGNEEYANGEFVSFEEAFS